MYTYISTLLINFYITKVCTFFSFIYFFFHEQNRFLHIILRTLLIVNVKGIFFIILYIYIYVYVHTQMYIYSPWFIICTQWRSLYNIFTIVALNSFVISFHHWNDIKNRYIPHLILTHQHSWLFSVCLCISTWDFLYTRLDFYITMNENTNFIQFFSFIILLFSFFDSSYL